MWPSRSPTALSCRFVKVANTAIPRRARARSMSFCDSEASHAPSRRCSQLSVAFRRVHTRRSRVNEIQIDGPRIRACNACPKPGSNGLAGLCCPLAR